MSDTVWNYMVRSWTQETWVVVFASVRRCTTNLCWFKINNRRKLGEEKRLYFSNCISKDGKRPELTYSNLIF